MSSKLFVAFSLACLISVQAFGMSCESKLSTSGEHAKTSKELAAHFRNVLGLLEKRAINQGYPLSRMAVAAIMGGHLLIQGPTGNGKTSTTLAFAQGISGKFARVQFTVDTTPTELTGHETYNQLTHEEEFHEGSLVGNVVLADELNRATPKAQGAMLEAMDEGKITVNRKTHNLPKVYVVVATQNPSKHLGTFPLIEAQKDRFLFMIEVHHNDMATEEQILEAQLKKKLEGISGEAPELSAKMSLEDILRARKYAFEMEMTPEARKYILKLIDATRNPLAYSKDLARYLREGVGSRGTFGLEFAARGIAWLSGKSKVELSDVKEIEKDVLRHRLSLSDDAIAEDVPVEKILNTLISVVEAKK